MLRSIYSIYVFCLDLFCSLLMFYEPWPQTGLLQILHLMLNLVQQQSTILLFNVSTNITLLPASLDRILSCHNLTVSSASVAKPIKL